MKKWFIIGGVMAAVGAGYAVFTMRKRRMARRHETETDTVHTS